MQIKAQFPNDLSDESKEKLGEAKHLVSEVRDDLIKEDRYNRDADLRECLQRIIDLIRECEY